MDRSIAEQLFYSTTKIVAFENGAGKKSGTGFFYAIANDTGGVIHIFVTNRHVLDGSDAAMITVHLREKDGSEPSGEIAKVRLELGELRIDHPDPKIDLAAVGVGYLTQFTSSNGQVPIWISFDRTNVPTAEGWDDFDAIEPVLMIGCPNGLFDEVNGLPLIRRGSTSSNLRRNYMGKNEFMVDLACFPGSSGSPVVILNNGPRFNHKTGNTSIGGAIFSLIGILYAGPIITNTGHIVLSQNPSVAVASTMHLGQVIRSTELLVLEAHVLATIKGYVNAP